MDIRRCVEAGELAGTVSREAVPLSVVDKAFAGISRFWRRGTRITSQQNGRYQLLMRSAAGQSAASKLLPGFAIAVTPLFETS